jgi:hypothetical protein
VIAYAITFSIIAFLLTYRFLYSQPRCSSPTSSYFQSPISPHFNAKI